MIGEVKEKQAARHEYNAAISRGETAALLEQDKRDIFRQKGPRYDDVHPCVISFPFRLVGNIPPRSRVNIRITYVADLKVEADGAIRFVLVSVKYSRCSDSTTDSVVADGRRPSLQVCMWDGKFAVTDEERVVRTASTMRFRRRVLGTTTAVVACGTVTSSAGATFHTGTWLWLRCVSSTSNALVLQIHKGIAVLSLPLDSAALHRIAEAVRVQPVGRGRDGERHHAHRVSDARGSRTDSISKKFRLSADTDAYTDQIRVSECRQQTLGSDFAVVRHGFVVLGRQSCDSA